MSYTVTIAPVQQLDREQSLWSRPDFMQAAASLQSLEAWHLLCHKGNQLVACLPVYEKKLLSYRLLQSAIGSYYHGLDIWLEDNSLPARRSLDTLQIVSAIAQFIGNRYKKIAFNLSPDTMDVRGFSWNHLKAYPRYTFTHNCSLSLQPLPDERKKISLAAKQNYRFCEEFRPAEFMALFAEMNGRKNRHLGFTGKNLLLFLESLHSFGIMQQFNLYQEERIVSSNIMLQGSKEKAFTVFRATDPEALKTGASGLHTLKLIESFAGKPVELDFCGANIPEIARFKAALGLELKVFYQIHS